MRFVLSILMACVPVVALAQTNNLSGVLNGTANAVNTAGNAIQNAANNVSNLTTAANNLTGTNVDSSNLTNMLRNVATGLNVSTSSNRTTKSKELNTLLNEVAREDGSAERAIEAISED